MWFRDALQIAPIRYGSSLSTFAACWKYVVTHPARALQHPGLDPESPDRDPL